MLLHLVKGYSLAVINPHIVQLVRPATSLRMVGGIPLGLSLTGV